MIVKPPDAKVLGINEGHSGGPDIVALQWNDMILTVEYLKYGTPVNIVHYDHLLDKDPYYKYQITHVGFCFAASKLLGYMPVDVWKKWSEDDTKFARKLTRKFWPSASSLWTIYRCQ